MTPEQIEKELELAMSLYSMGTKLYQRLKQQTGLSDDDLLAMATKLGDENELKLITHIAQLEAIAPPYTGQ